MAKTIDLKFRGYWRDVNKGNIPNESGIYLVYVCKYLESTDKVAVRKLVYIGEAKEVRDRIEKHEKRPKWDKKVPRGSELCFSFAGATSPDRERAEAALIYHHKPSCNDEYVDEFPYEDTTVKSSGRCALLTANVTVSKTS